MLFRVSGFATGEPYFGKRGTNRFDDYRAPEHSRFGTCYLGLDIAVAVAETVLHDEVAVNARFKIAMDEIARRNIVTFTGVPLELANCTGVPLKRMGLDGSFSTELNLSLTQVWGVALHEHPDKVDGFVYVSRHINTAHAVVLFERAAGKLLTPQHQPLANHGGAMATLNALGVDFI